jgi:hypothetical protein
LRARALALAALTASLAIVPLGAAPAWGGGRFDDERPAGYDSNPKHQSNWEPTVAVDPNHPSRVYQLITGINATPARVAAVVPASCSGAPPTVARPSARRPSCV